MGGFKKLDLGLDDDNNLVVNVEGKYEAKLNHFLGDSQSNPKLATTILTNEQILALPSTPIEIIEAPGEGKAIIPIHAILSIFYPEENGGNIDLGSISSDCVIWLGPPPGIIGESLSGYLGRAGTNDVTNLLNHTFATVASILFSPRSLINNDPGSSGAETYAGPSGTSHPDLANHDNKPLQLQVNNTAGDFTGGDPENNGLIVVAYHTITLPA